MQINQKTSLKEGRVSANVKRKLKRFEVIAQEEQEQEIKDRWNHFHELVARKKELTKTVEEDCASFQIKKEVKNMSNEIQWKVISNSMSKLPKKHVIAVGYRSSGMGLNEIAAVIPMYDIRDSDLNGSVGFLEGGWSLMTKFFDPVYVFGIMKSLDKTCCLMDAASQLNDPFFWQETRMKALEEIFRLRHDILNAVLMKTFLTAHININVDLLNAGLVEMSKFSFGTLFFVKIALEKAVMASVGQAMKL